MAKRFTDTNKYKKPFMRNLPGAYKLFWDFLYHDCDHAGIWIVDFEIAQTYVGKDMPIEKQKAIFLLNQDEQRIVEIDGGKKWFIPSFIAFQYGKLSEKNRAHISVISVLKKYDLITSDFSIKPLTSTLQGAKEQDKDKEQAKDLGKSENPLKTEFFLIPEMQKIFKKDNPHYFTDEAKDYEPLLKISGYIAKIYHIPENILAQTIMEKHEICRRWGELTKFIAGEEWFKNYSLMQIEKHFQSIISRQKNGSSKTHIQKPSIGREIEFDAA